MKTLITAFAVVMTSFCLQAQVQSVLADLEEGITSTTVEYIASGDDINAKSKDYTLLNKAIEMNRGDVAMILIEKGADVNLKTNSKAPLVFAIKNGDSALVQALINAGAKVELAFEGEVSAEQLASRAGNIELSKMLRQQRLTEVERN